MSSISIANCSQNLLEIKHLQKGLRRIGIELSDSEINDLNIGTIISLKHLKLSEIGSVFILASAVCVCNLKSRKQQITFQDLPTVDQDHNCCAGIPIYCWESDAYGKRCIHLTLSDGTPALRTCNKS